MIRRKPPISPEERAKTIAAIEHSGVPVGVDEYSEREQWVRFQCREGGLWSPEFRRQCEKEYRQEWQRLKPLDNWQQQMRRDIRGWYWSIPFLDIELTADEKLAEEARIEEVRTQYKVQAARWRREAVIANHKEKREREKARRWVQDVVLPWLKAIKEARLAGRTEGVGLCPLP